VRRAEGAALDGECADRATIIVAATHNFVPARPIAISILQDFPSSTLSGGVLQPKDRDDGIRGEAKKAPEKRCGEGLRK
jgi:hypothetical protein